MSYTQSIQTYPPTGSNRAAPDRFDEIRNAERKILGEILCNPELINRVKARLAPDDFQTEKQRTIYGAMLNLHERNAPIDELTLWEYLRETGELDKAGGSSNLTLLSALIIDGQVKRDSKETDQFLYWFSK